MPLADVWNIFSTNLKFAAFAYDIHIHSFVLMSNHFHLLATAPHSNFSDAIGRVIEMCSRHMGHDLGRINQKFSRRFKRTRISTLPHFFNAYKYVYQNPIRAGLVSRVEDYPFSTLHSLMGKSQFLIPVEDETFLNDTEGTLKWLNELPTVENSDAVRRALRRREFSYPALKGRRPHPLEISKL